MAIPSLFLVDDDDVIVGPVAFADPAAKPGLDRPMVFVYFDTHKVLVPFDEKGPRNSVEVYIGSDCDDFYLLEQQTIFPLAGIAGDRVFAPGPGEPAAMRTLNGFLDKRTGSCYSFYNKPVALSVPAVEIFNIANYVAPFKVVSQSAP